MKLKEIKEAMEGRWWVLLVGVLGLAGCAVPVSYTEPFEARGAGSADKPTERAAEERPGLATGFGKEIKDEWHRKSFVRSASQPIGTDVIYYNDRAGIEAMTGYRSKVGALQTAAGGTVEWGIKGRVGFLPSYKSYSPSRKGDQRYVVGSAGAPYSIYVKNRCKSQVEVVLSADGLDVIDGKPAAFRKRGYVIPSGQTLEVRGWRSGWDRVARFEFSSVAGSYANRRHGDARNVGVIGLAVFGEKGVDPWTWMPDEIGQRQTANPFATAP
ncbi:hypothetical protein [Haloferula rosea]|uniref:Lipoprotein n=1 Tax=Haloferula rosea TaxID=490093 RepID=A0A934RB00_9BACT|nr:hypothetical protein [Haloferula rosea]MBK1826453.1 hypothetical protein [Haloferula rosea]